MWHIHLSCFVAVSVSTCLYKALTFVRLNLLFFCSMFSRRNNQWFVGSIEPEEHLKWPQGLISARLETLIMENNPKAVPS